MTFVRQMKLISAEKLADLVNQNRSDILLVDCRSFITFSCDHILSSVNANVPSIVARRKGGILPPHSLITSPAARQLVLSGQCMLIVVYDENGQLSCDHSSPSFFSLSTAGVILRSFDRTVVNLCYLEGGFEHFRRQFPNLCSSVGGKQQQEYGPALHQSSNHHHHHQWVAEDAAAADVTNDLIQVPVPTAHKNVSTGTGPVEIMPWLFIGSMQHATMTSRLRELGITAVLNVSTQAISPRAKTPNVLYEQLAVEDGWNSELKTWLPKAIDILDRVHSNGGRILVHCQAGISRSATVCIGYLMARCHMDFDKAFDHVRACRSQVSPNLNFLNQLKEYEQELAASLNEDRMAKQTTAIAGKKSRSLPSNLSIPQPRSSYNFDNTPLAPCSAGGMAASVGPIFTFSCHSPVVLSPS